VLAAGMRHAGETHLVSAAAALLALILQPAGQDGRQRHRRRPCQCAGAKVHLFPVRPLILILPSIPVAPLRASWDDQIPWSLSAHRTVTLVPCRALNSALGPLSLPEDACLSLASSNTLNLRANSPPPNISPSLPRRQATAPATSTTGTTRTILSITLEHSPQLFDHGR
jgi:hypothetical protein